mgnify:CR=1 FL=1
MIELDKYEKQWILFCKGQLRGKYSYKGNWVESLKPMFTEIYGWNPDEDNNYNDYLNCIFKKLLSILMKINDNQSYINRQIEDVFFASFYKSFRDESELSIERAINSLCGLIGYTTVIDSKGNKRFDLDILEINADQFLVRVPDDIKNPKITQWSDGTTTLEFNSDSYKMDYDSFEVGVDEKKQLKEITLPKKGNYSIKRTIPKEFKCNLTRDYKWLLLTLEK